MFAAEREDEGLLEVVDGVEVGLLVGVGLAEGADVDEVVDELADVVGGTYVEVVEEAFGEGTELAEHVVAKAFGKLLAGDVGAVVVLGAAVGVDAAEGVVEGGGDEGVGLARVAGVGGEDGVDVFVKPVLGEAVRKCMPRCWCKAGPIIVGIACGSLQRADR